MDTISSRESNTSYLPWAGVIVGAVAFIFAIIAFMKVSSLKNEIADLKNLSARIDGIESQSNQSAQTAGDARNGLVKLSTDANAAFKQVSDQLIDLKGRLDKVEAGRPVRTAAPAGAAAAPAGAGGAQAPVAAAGEYIVKAGDSSGTKIAAANGVSLAELMAANPDVDWRRLHIGQKLKLPAKK